MSKIWLYLENDIDVSGFDIEKDFEYVGDFVNPMNLQPCMMYSRTAQTTSSGLIEGLTLVIPMKLGVYSKETNGQRARRLLDGRLIKWQGKTLEQMTDDECYECLRFVQERTGVYYV